MQKDVRNTIGVDDRSDDQPSRQFAVTAGQIHQAGRLVSNQIVSLFRFPSSQISMLELLAILVLVTRITGLDISKVPRDIEYILKALAYAATLFTIGRLLRPILRERRMWLGTFVQAYGSVFPIALALYFLGSVIGAIRGPTPAYSLWQTLSDAIVFAFAFLAFGWATSDHERLVVRLLQMLALGSALLLAGSLLPRIQDYPSCSQGIFFCALRGPFAHPNHLAYVLMTGSISAATIAEAEAKRWRGLWWLLAGVLVIGLLLTFGRGALLGAAVGLIGIILVKHARLGFVLSAAAIVGSIAILVLNGTGTVDWFRSTVYVTEVNLTSFQVSSQESASVLDEPGGSTAMEQIELGPTSPAIESGVALDPGRYTIVVDGVLVRGSNTGTWIRIAADSEGNVVASTRVGVNLTPAYIEGPTLNVERAGEYGISVGLEYEEPGAASIYAIKGVSLVRSPLPVVRFDVSKVIKKGLFTDRLSLWREDIKNLRQYGPLGVGAGNARSVGTALMHNLWLEQYGEGGVLGLVGFMGWLVIPLTRVRRAVLRRDLAWCVVAAMAALMVHSIFWTEFPNGLRFLTLVYVSLWTALATQRV